MSKAIALAKWMFTKGVKIDMVLINQIFKKQKLRNWENKVPSLNKENKGKTWEKKEKIPVDKRRYSIKMLEQ